MVRLHLPKPGNRTNRIATTLMAATFLVLSALQPAVVGAYSDIPGNPSSKDDIHGYITGTSWYDPTAGVCAVRSSQPISLEEAAEANAKIVIGIAKTLNLDQRGALIGLMTALTESNLKNYANNGIPVSKENPVWLALPEPRPLGNDHDSVGIIQQRVSTGWSTYGNYTNGADPQKDKDVTWQLMNPAYAAQAFFGTPDGVELPNNLAQPSALRKGLLNLDNWQAMDPGAAAQAVQISAFPDAYNRQKDRALALLDQFWASSPPITLPIPLNGDIGPDSVENRCIGGGSTAIIGKIREFAWPDYRDAGTSGALEKRPLYQDAVDRSSYKGSCDGIDCGAFVTIVMRESGADPNYNKDPEGNTTQQIDYLRRNSAPLGTKYTRVTDKTLLQPGDIAVRADGDPFPNRGGHTFFFVGTAIAQIDPSWTGGQSASSSQCERSPMASGTDTFENYEWYHLN